MKLRAAAVLACAFAMALTGRSAAIAQTGNVKAAIEAGNKKFLAAFAAGNAAALGAMYTDDAIAFPPNSDQVRGRAAIQKLWEGVLASGVKQATLTTQEAEAHGDTAHEVGTYSMKDGSGKELDRGKYVVIWKRAQGQWKLHRDIWNTNMPVTK